ncbi:MAG: copper amine oxidase N-terminal domain-containing protein [Ruminococcaceae bacterium]|nr:copper amine oxidase N-terminal domain-containing protein [Oscillospiraceae bacterium]
MDRLQLRITNQQGKEVWREKAEKGHFSKSLKIAHGKYYFHVVKGEGQGSYNFFITDGGIVSDAAPSGDVITVKVNNKNVSFDQPPVLENGRTLVPLRAIFEALGAKVSWDPNTQTVTATKGDINISLQIGSANMNVNGANKVLDVPAKIMGGRTLVPVRAISEAFGCDVNWEGATKTVIVNSR